MSTVPSVIIIRGPSIADPTVADSYTITMPGGFGPRVLAATCWKYGYQALVPDPSNPGQTTANPMTMKEFAARQRYAELVQMVKDHEASAAATAAQQASVVAIDTTAAGATFVAGNGS